MKMTIEQLKEFCKQGDPKERIDVEDCYTCLTARFARAVGYDVISADYGGVETKQGDIEVPMAWAIWNSNASKESYSYMELLEVLETL